MMVVVLVIILLIVIIAVVAKISDNEDREFLRNHGVTVTLPILNLRHETRVVNDVSLNSMRIHHMYYIEYSVDDKEYKENISPKEYKNLKVGDLIQVTHADGIARYNLDNCKNVADTQQNETIEVTGDIQHK